MANDWQDDDDQLYEDSYIGDADGYADDWEESDLITCSACGALVDEDAIYCPVCDASIESGPSIFRNKSWWWIVLGIAGMVAVTFTLVLF